MLNLENKNRFQKTLKWLVFFFVFLKTFIKIYFKKQEPNKSMLPFFLQIEQKVNLRNIFAM